LDEPTEPVPTPTPPPVREYIEPPRSIEDLRRRKNFVAPFKVTPDIKLIDFLTPYSFEKLAPCGLSDCSTKHFYGYLVITSSGAETNIGHVCGEKAFGIDYKHARARFARDEDRRVTIGRVLDLQGQAPKIKEQIHELSNRQYGVRWVYNLRDAIKGIVGRQAFEHLKLRSVRREYAVIRSRKLLAEEKDSMGRIGGGKHPRYVNETLGQLAPMEWMQWDFPGALFRDVKDKFMLIALLKPHDMDTKELKRRVKDIENWEQNIREAETMLAQAVRFLDRDNLKLVDLALREQRIGGHQVKSLEDWYASEEYSKLLDGTFREGQTLS
jgi:hypothetical protein